MSATSQSRVRRVAVIGAECTGKTSLCRWLANDLPGICFEEPLRQWVANKGQVPTQCEQSALLRTQREVEEEAETLARSLGYQWVLCDSAPLVTAIYSDLYYADASLYRLALDHHRAHYWATLVCDQDLPWEADPGQRDGPAARASTHMRLMDCLTAHAVPWGLVSGMGATRHQLAQAFLAGVDSSLR
ncbi:MAG: hypothetical protein RLZZ344_1242 [Pseudomonadota bacterium]|jgi:nicotinamide riboside kinase